jgi:hypothetical protein
MSDILLSPDGVPLITEAERMQGPSISPRRLTDLNVPDRLCEYEEGAQFGCRRTQTILSLEAEYDTFVHPEMYWGFWDQWCRHEGYIYFNKYLIETLIHVDTDSIESDRMNQNILPSIDIVEQFTGSRHHRITTVDDIHSLFRNSPSGFPELILETPQFFQCKDIGQTQITIDALNRELLNKIQTSFTDSKVPLLSNLNGCLYLDGDTVYCTNYLAFEENTTARLGVLMIPTESTKYTIGNAYFFPFNPLTNEQRTFVTNLGLLELNMQGTVVIIDL